MPDWAVGVVVTGVACCAFYLEKIARSAAKVEKDLTGLGYQFERLERRADQISERLYGISEKISPGGDRDDW